RQPSGNTLPALPELADRSEMSSDAPHGDRNPAIELTLPSLDGGMPEASLPEISMEEAPAATQSHGNTPRSFDGSADDGADSAIRAQVRKQSTGTASQRIETDQRLKMEAPRLSVVLNGPSDLPIGAPADYQIVVRNQDSFDLNGLILRLDIPAGVQVQTRKP